MICSEYARRLIKYLSNIFPTYEILYATVCKQPDYPWNHAIVCVIDQKNEKFVFLQTISAIEGNNKEIIISPQTIKGWYNKRWWIYVYPDGEKEYQLRISGEKIFLEVYS